MSIYFGFRCTEYYSLRMTISYALQYLPMTNLIHQYAVMSWACWLQLLLYFFLCIFSNILFLQSILLLNIGKTKYVHLPISITVSRSGISVGESQRYLEWWTPNLEWRKCWLTFLKFRCRLITYILIYIYCKLISPDSSICGQRNHRKTNIFSHILCPADFPTSASALATGTLCQLCGAIYTQHVACVIATRSKFDANCHHQAAPKAGSAKKKIVEYF